MNKIKLSRLHPTLNLDMCLTFISQDLMRDSYHKNFYFFSFISE